VTDRTSDNPKALVRLPCSVSLAGVYLRVIGMKRLCIGSNPQFDPILYRFWFHSHVEWTFICKHHLLFIYSHMFSWCVCHLKSANDAFKYNSDLSWFVCRSPLIACSFVIEMNDAWNLKEQIPCLCCTKNWSNIGSICIPQISYCFLSCPQNINKKKKNPVTSPTVEGYQQVTAKSELSCRVEELVFNHCLPVNQL